MPTAKGSQTIRRARAGQPGITYRRSVWAAGQEYRNDTNEKGDIRYIDICTNKAIALMTDSDFEAYLCVRSHTSSDSIPLGASGYWEKIEDMQFLMTVMLIAQRIDAAYINVEDLVADSGFIESFVSSQALIEALTVMKLDTVPTATGDKIAIDGDGLVLYDASGLKKARINHKSIGSYDGTIFANALDASTGISQPASLAVYGASTSGTAINQSHYFANINLGYFDKGSTITLDSATLDLSLDTTSTTLSVTVKSNPWLRLQVLKDGVVIKTALYSGTITVRKDSSRSITISSIGFSHTVESDGIYSIRMNPYNSSCLYAMVSEGSGQNGVLDSTAKIKVGFSRSNYQYTHIGKDGLMQVMGTGFLFSNSDTFVVRRGSTMFRVTSSGIEKSSDGGVNWTTL